MTQELILQIGQVATQKARFSVNPPKWFKPGQPVSKSVRRKLQKELPKVLKTRTPLILERHRAESKERHVFQAWFQMLKNVYQQFDICQGDQVMNFDETPVEVNSVLDKIVAE
jgi:hypothetical protein